MTKSTKTLLVLLLGIALPALSSFASENLVKNPSLTSKDGSRPDFWSPMFYKAYKETGHFEYKQIEEQNCFTAVIDADKSGGQIKSVLINVEPGTVYKFDVEYYTTTNASNPHCSMILNCFDADKSLVCALRVTDWSNKDVTPNTWHCLSKTARVVKIDSKTDIEKAPTKNDLSVSFKDSIATVQIVLQFGGGKNEISWQNVTFESVADDKKKNVE